MRPHISIDTSIVTANARAWAAFAGTPLYAVLKGDGYGWGIAALVKALDGHVGAFCISDEDELRDLRRHTDTRAILLGSVPLDRLEAVLSLDALPCIGTTAELRLTERFAKEHGRPLRVRVGLRPAASWSGLPFDELSAFAPELAESKAEVELWSHLTDWETRA